MRCSCILINIATDEATIEALRAQLDEANEDAKRWRSRYKNHTCKHYARDKLIDFLKQDVKGLKEDLASRDATIHDLNQNAERSAGKLELGDNLMKVLEQHVQQLGRERDQAIKDQRIAENREVTLQSTVDDLIEKLNGAGDKHVLSQR